MVSVLMISNEQPTDSLIFSTFTSDPTRGGVLNEDSFLQKEKNTVKTRAVKANKQILINNGWSLILVPQYFILIGYRRWAFLQFIQL
ncbi:MAG: hypothetical protein ACOC6P_00790 [Candidatus Aminicenantaceae bacterium]